MKTGKAAVRCALAGRGSMCPHEPTDPLARPVRDAAPLASARLTHLVVSYDVVDDRRRVRLAKHLAGHLYRVQFSVFEGDVATSQVPALIAGAAAEIDPRLDSLRVYYLCKACVARSEIFGTAPTWPSPDEDEVL